MKTQEKISEALRLFERAANRENGGGGELRACIDSLRWVLNLPTRLDKLIEASKEIELVIDEGKPRIAVAITNRFLADEDKFRL